MCLCLFRCSVIQVVVGYAEVQGQSELGQFTQNNSAKAQLSPQEKNSLICTWIFCCAWQTNRVPVKNNYPEHNKNATNYYDSL